MNTYIRRSKNNVVDLNLLLLTRFLFHFQLKKGKFYDFPP